MELICSFIELFFFFPGRLLFCACKNKSKIFVDSLSKKNNFRIYTFTFSSLVFEIRRVTEGRTDTIIYIYVCMCMCRYIYVHAVVFERY